MPAIAIANNDTVLIAWSIDAKIGGCVGFTIRRVDVASGASEPLPAYVGFAGESNDAWKPKTTDQWPIQKFSWKDLFAKPGGTYKYEIIALEGPADAPRPIGGFAPLETAPVTVTADHGPARVVFNRGIISTQATARDLTGGADAAPSQGSLLERIAKLDDSVRVRLAGQMPEMLQSLLERADKEGGTIYAALYELTDPELVARLVRTKNVKIILSNANSTASGEPVYDGENAAARAALGRAGHTVVNRYMPDQHIGHNKFLVYEDAQGVPRAILSGSTNWTATGLCTQSNNAVLIESKELATHYGEYWQRLAEDAAAAGDEPGAPAAPNSSLQSDALRSANVAAIPPVALASAQVQPWFSPNTKQRSKPTLNAATPADMATVFEAMRAAESAILFLAFQPGAPSILSEIEAIIGERLGSKKAPLLVRGAITDPQAAGEFAKTILVHRADDTDASVVGVQGVSGPFAYWHKELYKVGHAVIHDKIVVIDPLGDDCVVITGSHNLGFRASYNNDENLLMIRGAKSIAAAYATHIMDVYDHYRWRWYLAQKGKPAAAEWKGLFPNDDSWQDRYFTPGHLAMHERLFWVSGGEPGRAPAPSKPRLVKPAATTKPARGVKPAKKTKPGATAGRARRAKPRRGPRPRET